MIYRESVKKAREGVKMGVALQYEEPRVMGLKGQYIMDLRDSRTGEQLDYRELPNLITLDAGVYSAILWGAGASPSPAQSGLTMLAVGTGALGSILSPDAPDPRQRGLNAEVTLGRKAFVSRQYRTSVGAVSTVATNVLDLTTTFGEGEAVGPLNEMGLMRTISQNPAVRTPITPSVTFPTYNPAVDLTLFDVLVNYTTFGCLTKPSNAVLTITWRLTF